MAVFPISAEKTAWNSTLTPGWSVTEEISASGRRRSLVTHLLPKWVFSCKFPNLTNEEADSLLGFWNARKGTFESFFYKDFTHCKVTGQKLVAGSDGKYQCLAIIGGYTEAVYKVDELKVYVDGVETTDYTETNGKITLGTSGTVVKADYEYYFKVHFAGAISITEAFHDYNSASVKLEVVR